MALNPRRVVLDNGVTILAKSNHTTPALSLLIGVRTGAYADPPDREGTAALCARVLDRGTVTRSAEAIADDLDGRGASLSVIAGRHQMALAATCLTDDFAAVLALAADCARHPRFADAEIATRKESLITSIRQEEDNPATVAADAFAQALYGDHPYARTVRGRVPAVEAIRRQDLVRFHQKGFDPPAITVIVVGDVEEEAAVKAIATLFGDWSPLAKATGDKPAITVPDAPAITARNLVSSPMMTKAQADVVYGFAGIRRSDPDYIAASVMNNALGQFAIGGRLGDSIRERQGMAYYVYSSLDASFGPGPFSIRAGVSAANVERTIASIDAELRAVVEKGFTAQEIDESKSYLIGSMPRQLETNAAIASFLLNVETFGLGLDYDERLPGLISAVTKEAADAAARRLLNPERATIAVAGPWTPGMTPVVAVPIAVAEPVPAAGPEPADVAPPVSVGDNEPAPTEEPIEPSLSNLPNEPNLANLAILPTEEHLPNLPNAPNPANEPNLPNEPVLPDLPDPPKPPADPDLSSLSTLLDDLTDPDPPKL